MQEWLLEVWASFSSTILFVTHDVDEALYLADRVIVLSARPGQVIGTFEVPFERPRDHAVVTSDAFAALQARGLRPDLGRVAARRPQRAAGVRTRSFASAVIPPLLVFLLLGLIWHLIVTVNDVQSFIMPTPVQVGEKLWEDRDSLIDAAARDGRARCSSASSSARHRLRARDARWRRRGWRSARSTPWS